MKYTHSLGKVQWFVHSQYRLVELADLPPLPSHMEGLLNGSSKLAFVPDESSSYRTLNENEPLGGVPSLLANSSGSIKDIERFIRKRGFLGGQYSEWHMQRTDEFIYHSENIRKVLDLIKGVKNNRIAWLRNNLSPGLASPPERRGFYKLESDEDLMKCAMEEIINRISPHIENVRPGIKLGPGGFDLVDVVDSQIALIYLEVRRQLIAKKTSECDYCGAIIPGTRKFCPPALSTEKESSCALKKRQERYRGNTNTAQSLSLCHFCAAARHLRPQGGL